MRRNVSNTLCRSCRRAPHKGEGKPEFEGDRLARKSSQESWWDLLPISTSSRKLTFQYAWGVDGESVHPRWFHAYDDVDIPQVRLLPALDRRSHSPRKTPQAGLSPGASPKCIFLSYVLTSFVSCG